MRFTDNQSLDTASMANLDILAGTDVSSGTDKKFTLANLASWFLGQFNGLSLAGSNQTVQAAIDEMSETKADADGTYDDMVVGTSKQLLSDSYTEDFTPYKFRRSPYTDRLSESIVGASVAWNQLVNVKTASITPNGSATYSNISVQAAITANHIYVLCTDITYSGSKTLRAYIQSGSVYGSPAQDLTGSKGSFAWIIKPTANRSDLSLGLSNLVTSDKLTSADAWTRDNTILFDLTQMFGTTVADALYAMGADGVALFRSWYPKAYYPYSEPTLEHVSGLEAHEMIGFNVFDIATSVLGGGIDTNTGEFVENASAWRSDYMRCLPETQYHADGLTASMNNLVAYYDANKEFISRTGGMASAQRNFTTPSGCNYIAIMQYAVGSQSQVFSDGRATVCINISDSAKNGTYKPYSKHSYALDDSLTLRGLLKYDSTKGFYADGDVYKADGTVTRKYGIVDLGTLNWSYNASYTYPLFAAGLSGVKYTDTTNVTMICSKYRCIPAKKGSVFRTTNYSESIAPITDQGANNRISAQDTSYTDAASFKAAMSGVYLVYELATATTESAEPYDEIQITDGTEEYVSDCLVPVGHESKYYENLRSKIEGLPTLPTAAGTYRLTVTVSSGKATYTWTAS